MIYIATPEELAKRRAADAEKFLADYGFVRGQHFDSDGEALKMAAKVFVEMKSRLELNQHGFFSFWVRCGRGDGAEPSRTGCDASCRGWDGKSDRCECGKHWVHLSIGGIFPSVDWVCKCVCCSSCPNRKAKFQHPCCGEQFCSFCEKEYFAHGCPQPRTEPIEMAR